MVNYVSSLKLWNSFFWIKRVEQYKKLAQKHEYNPQNMTNLKSILSKLNRMLFSFYKLLMEEYDLQISSDIILDQLKNPILMNVKIKKLF